MRIDIDIRVEIPEGSSPEKRLEFIEGVMAVFRAAFPDVSPLLRPDAPSPVTVTIREIELEEYKPDPSAKRIRLPQHEDILKATEESKTLPDEEGSK